MRGTCYMQEDCAAKRSFTMTSILAAVTAFADGISRRDLDELVSPRAFDTGEFPTCTSLSMVLKDHALALIWVFETCAELFAGNEAR